MAKLKKIVVGVDFSSLSLEALDYALNLARGTRAKLSVLYVVEPIDYTGIDVLGGAPIATQAVVDEHLRRARREMERLRARKLRSLPGAKAVVRVGRPVNEIADAGGRGSANLIVIGTHGRSGLAHLVMGSVAERVVRQASCPVLIVPSRAATRRR